MKSNLLIIVLIAKILADNLWGLSPESIADNVYYVSQSAWFLLTTISIAFIVSIIISIVMVYEILRYNKK